MNARFVLVVLAFLVSSRSALSANLSGDLFGVISKSEDDYQLTSRYSPRLESEFDFQESSLMAFAEGRFQYSETKNNSENQAEVNRAWIRWNTESFSVRVGRQKVNFGPSKVLRPLQWFDQIDPRDIVPYTRGVDGSVAKFFLEENHSLWFWTFQDSQLLEGTSLLTTKENTYAQGGRIELYGNHGFSYIQRKVELADTEGSSRLYGFDTVWDLGAAVWFEAEWEQAELIPKNQLNVTLGLDYTFNIGNGIYLLVEHNYQDAKDSFPDPIATTAIRASYPLDLIDNISFLGIQSTDFNYQLIQFTRTLDEYLWGLGIYYQELENSETGVQLTAQWSH